MQKPDLIGAFKLATQRNQNIAEVKKSLIAAGYDAQDVEDSASAFSQGQVRPVAKPLPTQSLPPSFISSKPSQVPSQPSQIQQSPASVISQSSEQPENQPMPRYLLITIISSVVIILGLLGYVIYKIITG